MYYHEADKAIREYKAYSTKPMKSMLTNHYAGELAYFDSFAGLIKCKVLEVLVDNQTKTQVKVKLTQSRKPFKVGEELELHGAVVVPRECVKRSGNFHVIVTNYKWKK